MKQLIASLLLLCSPQALFPAAAAPADTPAGVVTAAMAAVDGDNLGEFFTQFNRIPFNNVDRATVLNHLFAKPQFMMGDVAKQSLITILHDMHKNRFTAVGPIAAQLKISMEWREYLNAANAKLADLFEWIDGGQKKRQANTPVVCEKPKELVLSALAQINAIANAAKNKLEHPCAIARQIKAVLDATKAEHMTDVAMNNCLQPYIPDETRRYYILGLLQKQTKESNFLAPSPKAAALYNALRLGQGDRCLNQISLDHTAGIARLKKSILEGTNTHFPDELLTIMLLYDAPYRLGRSIWKNDSWHWVGGGDGNAETRMLDCHFKMIDDISLIPYLEYANCISNITIFGHLMEQLPTDIWQYLPNLRTVSIQKGLLTDYPAEIEQLLNLEVFNLDGNPLNAAARERYNQFQETIRERNIQRAEAARAKENWPSNEPRY